MIYNIMCSKRSEHFSTTLYNEIVFEDLNQVLIWTYGKNYFRIIITHQMSDKSNKKLSDYRLQKISTSFDVGAQELKAFKTKDPVLRQEILKQFHYKK